MTDITISVFVFSSSKLSYSDSDIDLFSKISKTIPQTLLELGFNCILRSPIVDGNQEDMIHACLEDDIIVFDGSLEEDENGSWDSNYAAATSWPLGIDNILVVSRTQLPLNFQALRTNVPELGQEKRDQNNRTCYKYSNDEIVQWISKELEKMSESFLYKNENGTIQTLAPRIPVPDSLKQRTLIREHQVREGKTKLSLLTEKIQDSLSYMNRTRKRGAFISYRSYYYHNPYHGKTALDLKKLIKEYHGDNDYPVTVYAEGEITFEFMTEQKRWIVEKFVDKKLRNVDEVWIFETGNEDGYGYYDSWWTCGEIISLMYIKASGVKLPKIFVYRYDPTNQKMIIEEKNDNYIPNLSESLRRELAKYFTYADGNYEVRESIRAVRKKNIIFQRFNFYYIKGLASIFSFIPSNEDYKELSFDDHKELSFEDYKELSFKDYKEYLFSHAFDENFTDNYIVYCPPDQNTSRFFTIKDFENPQFIMNFIRINSCIENGKFKEAIERRGYFSISPIEMQDIINNKKWVCKSSNKELIIRIKEAEEPIFKWWPISHGNKTGPNGVIIERTINWVFEK